MVKGILFSPTGGTKRVLDILLQELTGEQVCDLSHTVSENISFHETDTVIIAVPSFGGRVPAIALERLKTLAGNGAKAILVVTYGNRAYDDTLLELQECVEHLNFHVVGAIAAVTEHSIMRQYGTGRPDAQDEEALRLFAKKIKENTWKDTKLHLPGNHPYREYTGVPLKPKANHACTACGLCARECPVSAIPLDHPDQTNIDACISCMRCIAICPNNARSLNKLMVAAAAMKLKSACKDRKENALFL